MFTIRIVMLMIKMSQFVKERRGVRITIITIITIIIITMTNHQNVLSQFVKERRGGEGRGVACCVHLRSVIPLSLSLPSAHQILLLCPSHHHCHQHDYHQSSSSSPHNLCMLDKDPNWAK